MEEDYKKHYKKLYEDALETAKAYYKQNKGVVDGVECLSIIFPELKESEDERIRKELISLIKETHVTDRYYDLNKMLAWLEKQGERTTDKIIERARTEKQRVLLTETNGNAHIDWNCRNLQDVKLLLKYGLEYIDTQFKKQGEKNESKKFESWTAWGEEDKKILNTVIAEGDLKPSEIQWLKSLKERMKGE